MELFLLLGLLGIFTLYAVLDHVLAFFCGLYWVFGYVKAMSRGQKIEKWNELSKTKPFTVLELRWNEQRGFIKDWNGKVVAVNLTDMPEWILHRILQIITVNPGSQFVLRDSGWEVKDQILSPSHRFL